MKIELYEKTSSSLKNNKYLDFYVESFFSLV